MQTYDFDKKMNRRGTESIKWDGLSDFYGEENLLPFWVADMDFKSPPEVIEVAINKASFGVYGYPNTNEPAFNAFIEWQKNRHDLTLERRTLMCTPGVVTALSLAVQTFTAHGDGIVIQPPVYTPFFEVVELNDRQLLQNPLVFENDSWTMDFKGLEEIFMTQNPKMMILCNPHNPLGIVWSKETLEQLAALCKQYNVLLVSDEIHGDLIFKPNRFESLVGINAVDWSNAMVATAPSKTFNIAGLFYSIIMINDRNKRHAYKKAMEALHLTSQNVFNVLMAEAAYKKGAPWLEALLDYLEANADYLVSYLNEKLPEAVVIKPQGTYLAWINLKAFGLSSEDIMLRCKTAGIAVSNGKNFGVEGESCIRFNFGCPREQLKEGLEKLVTALKP